MPGRLTNRTQQTMAAYSDAGSVAGTTKSKVSVSKRPAPHLIMDGGKDKRRNPIVAVLYYFDKVMYSQ